MPRTNSPAPPTDIPSGPVTDDEVIGGIRRMAHGETADTTKLRAWELLGRIIGLFSESAGDGGATVIRLTPSLDHSPQLESEEGDDRERQHATHD